MIGTKLAHYEITSRLGSGGMGEVYQASDSKLGRSVAIKILPAAFASDADRLSRFLREAQLLATLNHPNIAHIYGLEESGDTRCIVLELIEGETLQARIKKGRIPVDEALVIAKQIAEALEAAHEKGVIHRDLKPGNVMLTADGRVKVLDFGLAKAYDANPGSATSSNSPTMASMAATNAAVILGTAAYMAPEQARGKTVDKRADIWAFGVVLFEMLTGQRAFPGEDLTDTLASVVKLDPKWDALGTDVSSRVRQVLRVCLQKDPTQRAQAIGDVRLALDGAFETSASPPSAQRDRLPWMAFAVAVLVGAMVAIPAVRHWREAPPAAVVPLRFQIPAPQNALAFPYLSPDGRKVIFFVGGRMWVHFLESGESSDLTDTDGGAPFWSPDSRYIGYTSKGRLKKIEATGGPAQTVADLSSNSLWGCGAWSRDDVIVFGDRPVGLFRVPAAGGVPVQITSLDLARHENSQYCPSFLPDGKHFVYMRSSTDEGKSAIYLGSVDEKPEQQSSKALVASNSQPVYAPSRDPNTGYLLFILGDTLMAQPFDNLRMELKGQAAPVAKQVRNKITGASFTAFSASDNDILTFPRVSPTVSQLTWFDRQGKLISTVGESGSSIGNPRLSPDGTRLAGIKGAGGADSGNIWVMDLSRGGASTRLTFGSPIDNFPVWAPDGNRIIFCSNRDGPFNLYEKSVNGLKGEELLLKSNEDKIATSWSRDGRFLLFTVIQPKTKEDIWVLPLDNGKKPLPFLITEFREAQARFSPDGHWVAYISDESGKFEVYIRSITINSAGTALEIGGQWHVSNGVGTDPQWRYDGQELYYRSGDGRLLGVEIATSPTFRAGSPYPLGSLNAASWDSTSDGKRFLTLVTTGGTPTFLVELNWQSGLKK